MLTILSFACAVRTPTFSPLAPGFGFEVHGLDMKALGSDSELQALLRRALAAANGLLVVRDVDLASWTPAEMHAFSLVFGAVEASAADGDFEWLLDSEGCVHAFSKVPSARVFDHEDAGAGSDADTYDAETGRPSWHTDQSFRSPSPRASAMLCVRTPSDGSGDTIFASTVAAYDALGEEERQALEGLGAEHSYAVLERSFQRFARRRDGGDGEGAVDCESVGGSAGAGGAEAAAPAFLSPERSALLAGAVVHPIVRRHAGSGRRCLYLAPHAMGRLVSADGRPLGHLPGRAPAESARDLFDRLAAHATSRPFRYRHRWRPGDLLVWDNTCTMHAATQVPPSVEMERLMWRTTILDEKPLVAGAQEVLAVEALARSVFRHL